MLTVSDIYIAYDTICNTAHTEGTCVEGAFLRVYLQRERRVVILKRAAPKEDCTV